MEAVCAMHGGDQAVYIGRSSVREIFDGEVVWEGEVLSFSLKAHPTASKCFAWEVDGEVTAVLGVPPVESARDAVRASIMADGVDPEA